MIHTLDMRGGFFSLEAAAFADVPEGVSGFAAFLVAVLGLFCPFPLAAFGVGFFSAGVLALVFGVLGVLGVLGVALAGFFSAGVLALDLTVGVAVLPLVVGVTGL